jgi:diguanylate cyclase (GGDEF)-like protein
MKKYQFDEKTFSELENLKTPLAIYQFIDKRVVTILLSDGFLSTFGYSDKSKAYYDMDNNMYKDAHPDDVARIADEAFRFATEGGKYEVVYRTLTKDRSEYKIIHAMGEHVMRDGVRLAYVWYTDEGSYVTEESEVSSLNSAFRKSLHEENIIKASYFDYLTGLPSMSYFFELADAGRKNAVKNNKTNAIVYMDLCGMKYFNRKHGFSEGDKLLRSFSAILKKHFSSENCSRFGADHFCVFTTNDGLEEKLIEVFSELADLKEVNPLPVRAGISLDSSGKLDISAECDRAKYACDSMRNNFLSRFCYFNEKMLEKAEKHQYILDNFERAISEKWIQVYHQPIIRAANGRVSDEEALARWIDPVECLINPDEFIPILEEANLIYKLDLYVLEQVLEKMETQEKEGLFVVPESINLSRLDFDTCNIVEEIRERVDKAGIDRGKINIEITESTLGNDMEFMKTQILRFKNLGFNVWMDDFGSGYSSLDVLQRMPFDLIKFDIRFMHEFNNGDRSKIMLTELIRMAIALGIDTICEGVETKEQANFLREIGCTMLQGYYFCAPIPLEEILERYRTGIQIGFENPEESDYYAAIGRVNLYDLAILANEDEEAFEHYFNTLPMAIFQTDDESFSLIRCNNSYRKFMEKNYGTIVVGEKVEYAFTEGKKGFGFLNAVRECGKNGNKLLLNEELSSGSIAHAFLKRIAKNPHSGTMAVAVAVLAVVDGKSSPITFTQVAKALSSDYISLYYVNLINDKFIEYKSNPLIGELAVENRGKDFFEQSRKNALDLVYKDDREMFESSFSKENILRSIALRGAFTLTYRLIIDDKPTYVSLKAVRTKPDIDHMIIGVNNVDAHMRRKEALERMKEEQTTYSRIAALSGDFICIYTVDPVTNNYVEYSINEKYNRLNLPIQGDDFFDESFRLSEQYLYEGDLEKFRSCWSKENILKEIEKNGMFKLKYRLMIDGKPAKVYLKGALVEEKDGPQLIIGVTYPEVGVSGGQKSRGDD